MEYTPDNIDDETKDFINKYTSKTSAIPSSPVPLDIQFDDEAHKVFNGEIKYQQLSTTPEPTNFETLKGAFNEGSEWNTLNTFSEDLHTKNPFSDVAYDGWKISDDTSVFEGILPKNQGYIAKASSPMDAKNRQYKMLERQQDEEEWKDGSTALKILGGFASAATNPTSWIPIARAAKYAKLSEGILYNAGKVGPSVAVQSIAHEGLQNALKAGGNIHDFMIDSLIDTAAGTAFFGAGYVAGGGADAMKLWNARKLLRLNYDGMEIKSVIDDKGKIIGRKVVALPGDNVSAAQVSHAQEFVDSTLSKNGLLSVPYLGTGLTKAISAVNPITRGLTSRFPSIRGYANRIASHTLITQGVEEGKALPQTFDDGMNLIHAENINIQAQYHGYYLEAIGIDPSSNQASAFAQKTASKWKKKSGYMTEEEFGRRVYTVRNTGTQDENAGVNQAADMLQKEYDETYAPWREAHNYSEEFASPKTQKNYSNRVYNRDALQISPEKWIEMHIDYYNKYRKLYDKHAVPIENLKASIKAQKAEHQALSEQPNVTDIQIRDSALKLKSLRKKVRAMKDKFEDEMRNNDAFAMHLVDPKALSAKEATQLKKILKPKTLVEKEIKVKTAQLAKKKQEAFLTSEKLNATKTAVKAKKNNESVKNSQKEVLALEDEIRNLKDKLIQEEDKLQDLVVDGKVQPHFYVREAGTERVKFKNPKERLKLEKPFESDFHIATAAEATRNTILNQTNEDTYNAILGKLTGNKSENAVKERTVPLPDETLMQAGFLSTNMALNVSNYRRALGRQTLLKTIFGDLSHEGGLAPLAEELNKDHAKQLAQILKKREQKLTTKQEQKINKEIRKLNKDFNEAKEYMALSFNRMMGKSMLSDKQRKFGLVAQLLSVITKLGFLPLTMATDLMAIVYKNGVMPTIMNGLLPMLRSFGGHIKEGNGSEVRAIAAHAHLANNHVISHYTNRHMNAVTEQHVPMQGKIMNGLEWLAHVSNNFNLSTYAENYLQRWTASVVQSRIMKAALSHVEGKLTDKENRIMLLYGIDMKKDAEGFVKGWKERGSDGNGFGGYSSRYWEWADAAASNKFAKAVMKATRDTVIRKGMMDSPFFADSSLWGTLYSTFKGWTFASGTRYLMPLLQDPKDAQKLIGTFLMLGMGSMQDPIRKLAEGKELTDDDLKPGKLFIKGFTNSGVFSIPAEALQELNIVFGGKLLKGITNERYRDRTIAGIAAGPAGGITEDLIKILMMAGTGNYNERDVTKMVGMLPLTQSVEFRGILNKRIEALGLPKTYADAQNQ